MWLNPYTAMGLVDSLGPANEVRGWVVQNGANSAVGKIVHNICKDKGFKSIALVRKPDSVEEMKKEGADKTIATGNFKTAEDHTNAILEATDGINKLLMIIC